MSRPSKRQLEPDVEDTLRTRGFGHGSLSVAHLSRTYISLCVPAFHPVEGTRLLTRSAINDFLGLKGRHREWNGTMSFALACVIFDVVKAATSVFGDVPGGLDQLPVDDLLDLPIVATAHGEVITGLARIPAADAATFRHQAHCITSSSPLKPRKPKKPQARPVMTEPMRSLAWLASTIVFDDDVGPLSAGVVEDP